MMAHCLLLLTHLPEQRRHPEERTVRSAQSVHEEMRLGGLQVQTARQDLPVRLADPVIGLDGIFLIHVLFTVGPTGPGINVRLLEVPGEIKK